MRAPVYRSLDARSTFLGLVFPAEWMLVLGAGWIGTAVGAPNLGGAAAFAIYLALRLATVGKPEGHLQHLVAWQVRQARTAGRLSAASRALTPQFPFGTSEWRDRGGKGGRS